MCATMLILLLLRDSLCADNNSALGPVILKLYGYGAYLQAKEHKLLPHSDDPLLDEFTSACKDISSHNKLISMCRDGRIDAEMSNLLQQYENDANSARDALADVKNGCACIRVLCKKYRAHMYYKSDLVDDPLFVAAKALKMNWLVNGFSETVTHVCRDGEVIHEKRWVLEDFCVPAAGRGGYGTTIAARLGPSWTLSRV